MLSFLRENGEQATWTVKEISRELNLPQKAVFWALDELVGEELVDKKGPGVYCLTQEETKCNA